MARANKAAPAVAALATALGLGACSHNPFSTASWGGRSLTERECMARAMYFESNRSSEDGMLAVGTVVMNRMQSGRYPSSACGVVGQPNQFAQGALSKPVSGRSWALALQTADSVLAGRRHTNVQHAMHFHTAGYTFPYRNMAYVVAAGGNVFYEKRTPGSFTPINPNVLVARAAEPRPRPSEQILLARVQERETRPALQSDLVRLASIRTDEAPRFVRAVETRHPSSPARFEEKRFASRADGERRVSERPGRDHAHERSRADRIRLAQLDDDALPRAVRARSDAGHSIPLSLDPPHRPKATLGEHAKSLKQTPLSRHETGKGAKALPDGKGVLLAYRDTKPKAARAALPPTKPLSHGSGRGEKVAAKMKKGG